MGSLSNVGRRLEGKVALILGGASGIGSSTAKLFCEHGAVVVVADIQDEFGCRISKDNKSTDSLMYCDATDEDEVRSTIDCVVAKYGKLDIMFNNVGLQDPVNPCIVDFDKSHFDRILNVNLGGVFLGTKHAARVMIPNRSGSIINCSSIAGVMAGLSSYAYTSAKHAVVALTKHAGVDLGESGIRVNCISPGGVATPTLERILSLPANKIEEMLSATSIIKGVCLKAEDVAQAALFLGSDDSKYVNGHNLVVDGGYTLVNPTATAKFGI